MRKITGMMAVAATVTMGLLFTGCGTQQPQKAETQESIEQEVQTENALKDIEEKETVETVQESLAGQEITFEDLSQKEFIYASGAGAWGESFTIEKDGSFTGSYNDSDMGDNGDDYPQGTRYISRYAGHFTDLKKVNDTVYEIKISDISYETATGTDEITDGFHYVYTESPCFGEADVLTIYLPDTLVKDIPEDVYSWLSIVNQDETSLVSIAMADLSQGIGMYSQDRVSALEDAKMNYAVYKESYDYYSDKASNAATTAEMVEYTGKMYEVSDECLNYVWHLIKYNVSEDEFASILTNQREWIAEKEARQKELEDLDNGSMKPVDRNIVLADMTITRCEELMEYLQ